MTFTAICLAFRIVGAIAAPCWSNCSTIRHARGRRFLPFAGCFVFVGVLGSVLRFFGLWSTLRFLACLASLFSLCLSGVAGNKVVSGDLFSSSSRFIPSSCGYARIAYCVLGFLVPSVFHVSANGLAGTLLAVLLYLERRIRHFVRGEIDKQSFSPVFVLTAILHVFSTPHIWDTLEKSVCSIENVFSQ
jgi:hypothetical protein